MTQQQIGQALLSPSDSLPWLSFNQSTPSMFRLVQNASAGPVEENMYEVVVLNEAGHNRVSLVALLEKEYLVIGENQAMTRFLPLEGEQFYRFHLASSEGVDSVSF